MRYKIKGWAKYQHYKDRSPPWIKLHSSLLTSETWVMSDDASKVLMIASMILASRDEANDGSFNGDPEFVRRVAYLTTPPNFNALIKCGFIECASGSLADASALLASCNTEKRREEKRNTSASSDKSLNAEAKPKLDSIRPNGSGWDGVASNDLALWRAAYPAVDITAELLAAFAWTQANPANRKSNYRRFLTNWLKRAQDRAKPSGTGRADPWAGVA